MCTEQCDSSYDELLAKTNLPSLKKIDIHKPVLCHLFKIIHVCTVCVCACIGVFTNYFNAKLDNIMTLRGEGSNHYPCVH